MQERRSVSETGIGRFYGHLYGMMGLGLVVTAVVTYLLGVVFQTQYLTFISTNQIFYYVAMFLPLIFVLFASSAKSAQNPARATTMFLLMAASEGTTLSLFMLMFKSSTAIAALLVTAVIFGTMSIVGIYGKRDLSRAGSIAFMFLIGAVLMSFLNFFMHSTGMAMILNYIILGVFIVLVAYDNQRLKQMYSYAEAEGDVAVRSLAVQGAIMLYLDFLNLFITILQIFGIGDSRN